MIKNRTVQLMYETIYCTLGLVGTIASFGIFDDFTNFRWDFYVHFTNISNFFCIGVMVMALIQTIKKQENDYVTACPVFKFIGMLGILLTFLVFNIMLAGAEGRNPQLNWRIGSLTFHVVLPIMYVAHWVLFYERKKQSTGYLKRHCNMLGGFGALLDAKRFSLLVYLSFPYGSFYGAFGLSFPCKRHF